MSCGKEHETPCDEVLERVFEYLDGEMGDLDCTKIQVHLDECSHCLDEYQRDELLKALVRRSCSGEVAPPALRTRIMATITTVQTSQAGHNVQTIETIETVETIETYRYEI